MSEEEPRAGISDEWMDAVTAVLGVLMLATVLLVFMFA